MKRCEERKVDCLLKTAHANRLSTRLAPTWHDSVMVEILHTGTPCPPTSDFERMAPGITLAATALSFVVLAIASLSLYKLPGELVFAYVAQGFDMSLSLWASL